MKQLLTILTGIFILCLAITDPLRAQVTFRPAQDCALCHSNAAGASAMRDHDQNPIAPFNLWHSSPMANAGRDLLWQAVVSAEKSTFPGYVDEIESTCTRCHTPIAWWQKHRQTAEGALTEDTTGSPVENPASEGISCTVCHQIADQEFGEKSTFSGHYPLVEGARAFGPHSAPFSMPMMMHTGFNPTPSEHVLESALCSSCHTLFTEPLGGHPSARMLAEQSPFLEWRLSSFSAPGDQNRTCQDCHMPKADEIGRALLTRIARNPMGRDFPPLDDRQPFGKHLLAGANTILPTLAEAGGSDVSEPEWTWRRAVSRFMLENNTAELALSSEIKPETGLVIDVTIRNRAGHKFPTAHPSRRAWIELIVTDEAGKTLFASGRTDHGGAILGPDDRPLPSEKEGGPVQPHFRRITSPEQVQIYQSIMADNRQAHTFRLLAGATYNKDNRITPRGWKAEEAARQDLGSPGTESDSDFMPGQDTVQYIIPLPSSSETSFQCNISARLLYQNLSHRFADELFALDTAEIQTLRNALDNSLPTETVAAVNRTIQF